MTSMTESGLRLITGAEPALERAFAPRAIAVVGASSRRGALNWWPLHLLRTYGFAGEIYPVNPNQKRLEGLTCYPSIADVPGPVDVAVVAVNAERVPEVVRQCADHGVGTVVIPAQGLGEVSSAGRNLQRDMVAYARGRGTRIAGPNADGVGNISTGALATIQPLFEEGFDPGPVAVVTQSGATAGSLLKRLKDAGVGCSLYASTGNEADLGLEDFLSYVVQNPRVEMVLSFVEAIRRPNEFRKVARLAAELDKPIALIKVGRSEQGAKRAAAHTGAMAGSDILYETLFRSLGVIRVSELSELVAVAKLYTTSGRPRSRGVGIISVSGGQAGAMADLADRAGLELPEITGEARARLDDLLAFGNALNPCDLTGAVATDTTLAGKVYGEFGRHPDIGLVVYGRKFLTNGAGDAAAEKLVAEVGRNGSAPLAVYAMDGTVEGREAAAYRKARVPVFDSIRDMFTAVAALEQSRRHQETVERQEAAASETRVAPHGAPSAQVLAKLASGAALNESDSKALLAAYGVPVTRESVVANVDAACNAAISLGYPVVLKVVSDDIPHKTEVGGVTVDIHDEQQLREAMIVMGHRIRTARPDAAVLGYSVQEQVGSEGVEVIAGATVDQDLGPFVMVGLGGVLTEVLDDVAFRPAPLAQSDALEMIGELRSAVILEGHRGGSRFDVEALADALCRLSALVVDQVDLVSEADLNPIFVLPEGQGARVADALVVGRRLD